ncbi:hypothetical protein NC652_033810 [Populus alba x Populus x berolinensis]|nr:hypothetical protein NC652_033810 [Populus alba x Populus x berolinensis]
MQYRLWISLESAFTMSGGSLCVFVHSRYHNWHERCNKESKRKKESHEKLEEGLSTLLADLNRYGLP